MSLKSYEAKYYFRRFPIEGGSFASLSFPFKEEREGPIFPYFMEADFSNYEDFLRFADDYGLDGFGWYNEALKKELDKRWESANEGFQYQPIKKQWLKNIWNEIKERLCEEQTNVRKFNDFQQLLQKEAIVHAVSPFFQIGQEEMIGGGLLFEHFGGLEPVAKILEDQVRPKVNVNAKRKLTAGLKFKLEIREGGGTMIFEFPAAHFRNTFEFYWEYASITARCYSEIVWIINDGKALKRCRCCNKPFVTKRSNEKYCDRYFFDERTRFEYIRLLEADPLKPSKRVKELENDFIDAINIAGKGKAPARKIQDFLNDPETQRYRKKILTEAARKASNEHQEAVEAFRKRHSCKKVGPRKTEKERLSKEELERKAERKRLLNKRGYLKKTGREDTSEYKEVSKALEKLGKKTRR